MANETMGIALGMIETRGLVPAIEAAGGKFLSTGAKVVARENGLAQKTVLIECENTRLPSLQIIVKNQEALKALADGSDGDIRLIEGV